MWLLATREILRHRLRTGLVIAALSIPVALRVLLASFGSSYERSLRAELDQMGVQLMIVPIGCPFDAAARIIKGKSLDETLPFAALDQVRADPAVAVAAPLLISAAARPEEKRVDLWVGLDESIRPLKPWWRLASGGPWFSRSNGVILGNDAAVIEMRAVGNKLSAGESHRVLEVEGILEPSGTSDDNLFFIPLRTAQELFHQEGRLTAIAVRLHQPELLPAAEQRLREIPGAQVATFTEMTGVFLNMVGSVRMLLQSIALLAVAICLLGVFNTMLAAVLERTGELALMRAVGASRAQIFALVTIEAVSLASMAAFAGGVLAAFSGRTIERLLHPLLPLVPEGRWWHLSGPALIEGLLVCVAAGLLAGLYPAWRACRIQPAEVLKPE